MPAATATWGGLAIAIAAVVIAHWLLPRVVFPRLLRRPRPLGPGEPKRWALTTAAGLGAYVALGLVVGVPGLALVIWGIAFGAVMAILYARTGR